MLVTSEPNSGPPSRTPSILNSPTLARVERARLRLEASSNSNSLAAQKDDSLERTILDSKHHQSLLAGRIPIASMTGPIKRGLLWQQRDRLFSRWKERYFVLTRDYLHCFKRASGSAAERISDMGQFIFKVKLVDVEKVEWLNRRSYSAIGLLLGREGRVLLRSDHGLEDWFELLEECILTSKERRRALKITQGPRSRASLAAPPSHASLQASHHFGLGGTYSSALDDWLMTRQKSVSSANPFLFSDSVPDLSSLNNENHHNGNGISTNHSTPKKIPYSSGGGGSSNVIGRYSINNGNHHGVSSSNVQNNSYSGSYYGSPRRMFVSDFGSNNVVDEEDEGEVQLRRPQRMNDNGNNEKEWMYRKPKGPNDNKHSAQTDIDYCANDSGLDTPPSTHQRPSSYRDVTNYSSPRDSTETTVSSSCGTMLASPGGSFRKKYGGSGNQLLINNHHYQQQQQVQHQQQQQQQQQQQHQQQQQQHQQQQLQHSRYSVQERILKIRNEEDRSASMNNKCNHNELYDPNQNRYYKMNANHPQQQHHSPQITNGNGSAIFRERYQHPALVAIINEAQGMKFRDRSYSDCQQCPRRTVNNNPSPSPRRAAFFGTPTRV